MRSTAIKTPAIVITLGTTSSMAANELCYHLLGLEQDDRDAVSIVMIDTDTSRPRFQDFLDEHAGAFHISKAQIAVPAGIAYTSLDNTVLGPVIDHTLIPTKLPQYFDYGAGGIRNNGHVSLCYDRDKVEKALREALAAVSHLSGKENEVRALSAQVYVVSFLGGGTGSGIVSDIAVMMRQMLTGAQKQQRLVLFGILPGDNMPGVSPNEESWRKSNATAALLEIMAHGLAARIDHRNPYLKYLLAQRYLVPDGPIFNEVYLLGRTNLDSVEDTARIVGLDLFQRITDASGVGDIERSKAPDRTVLAGSDDELLPTNFSASCPYEVRFPIEEARRAFAEVAASYMLRLPEFIGQRPPRTPPSDAQRNEWLRKWRGFAVLAPGTPGPNDLSVGQPRLFKPEEFEDAPSQQRDFMWQQLQRALGDMNIALKQVMERVTDREETRIRTVPTADQLGVYTALGLQGRKLIHFERLLAEYQEALDRLRSGPELTQNVPARPIELERKLERNLSLPAFVTDRIPQALKPDVPAAVAGAYNAVQRANYQRTRAKLLEQLLERVIAEVSSLTETEGDWLEGARAPERAAELQERGYGRSAWLGRLERPHQHQRHLFDLGIFTGKARTQGLAFVPAMEGVFRAATVGNDSVSLGDCMRRDTFDIADHIRPKVKDCIRYINAARRDADDADVDEDLVNERAAQVPQKVVEYFEQEYNTWLADRNLFDLLAIGIAAEENVAIGPAERKIQPYLQRHIENLRGILGELVTYEPGLWLNGSAALLPTLYMGMNWRDSERQREILDRTLNAVGALTDRSPKAQVYYEHDQHRLQVNYAQHGISIRTIPDFYNPTNSAMAEYLYHQKAWYGDPQQGTYGANQIPVHNSGEMERLVYGQDSQGTSIVQRVIRTQPQRRDQPRWSPPPDQGGPQGGPQGGFGPPPGPQGGGFPPPQGGQGPYGQNGPGL